MVGQHAASHGPSLPLGLWGFGLSGKSVKVEGQLCRGYFLCRRSTLARRLGATFCLCSRSNGEKWFGCPRPTGLDFGF